MMDTSPLVSVITVTFNCEDTIEDTIRSVLNQDYPNIQYIVIDGDSTDRTLEKIRAFKEKIDCIISEKDSGIYDAMNKGLQHARGEIIYYLNSGDRLFNTETIKNIVGAFLVHPEASLVFGDIMDYEKNNSTLKSMHRDTLPEYFPQAVNHQAIFSRKEVFKTVGNFDVNYPIFADRDWFFRCIFLNDLQICHIPEPVCYYLLGGGSSLHSAHYYHIRTMLLWNYLKKLKILIILMKAPKVLMHSVLLLSYSSIKTILLSLSENYGKTK